MVTRTGRPTVAVRDAIDDDMPELLEMWGTLRMISGRLDRTAPAPTLEGARRRLAEVAISDDTRVVVAVVHDEVAGFALMTTQPFAPLFDTRSVHVHYLIVRPAHRRSGVGHTLMGAAISWAEETGAEHVMTSVYPQLREVNRFYARLGLAPVVVRRAAPTALLRRRLAADGTPMTSSLARRRTLARVRTAVARVAGD
jgi:GNAT superfamily N-acetyltransferase